MGGRDGNPCFRCWNKQQILSPALSLLKQALWEEGHHKQALWEEGHRKVVALSGQELQVLAQLRVGQWEAWGRRQLRPWVRVGSNRAFVALI